MTINVVPGALPGTTFTSEEKSHYLVFCYYAAEVTVMLSPSYDINMEIAAFIVCQNPVDYQTPH